MNKILSYQKFSLQSVKSRMLYIRSILRECGYDIDISGKRDKVLVKIITSIQKENNITTNGIVDERTYVAIINKYNRRKV